MHRTLRAALDYVPRWLEFQMRLHGQPGCSVAIAFDGEPVLETAFGHADATRGTPMTPRHRFRVASHSKTFTATGILRLRDAGRLRLDDPIGRSVGGLPDAVGRLSFAQLLSHSAGLVRDGADAGQWLGRRRFKSAREILADLQAPAPLAPSERFKYSNHGYALLGMAIEAIAGEPWRDWIAREVIGAAGLTETLPDAPLPRGVPFARGHSALLPLGERVALAGDEPSEAVAPAGGVVSTAADLVRFYAGLDPAARRSIQSADARREMMRRLWPDPDSSLARWYGLGTMSGSLGGGDGPAWDWCGHSGVFPGYLTRSAFLPGRRLAVSVLTNAADGPCQQWLDGIVQILRRFDAQGVPSRRAAAWTGRWWTSWMAVDLLPMGDGVTVALPAQFDPFVDAARLAPAGRRAGVASAVVERDTGFGRHAEAARLEHDAAGRPKALWLGGTEFLPQAQASRELRRRAIRPAVQPRAIGTAADSGRRRARIQSIDGVR